MACMCVMQYSAAVAVLLTKIVPDMFPTRQIQHGASSSLPTVLNLSHCLSTNKNLQLLLSQSTFNV